MQLVATSQGSEASRPALSFSLELWLKVRAGCQPLWLTCFASARGRDSDGAGDLPQEPRHHCRVRRQGLAQVPTPALLRYRHIVTPTDWRVELQSGNLVANGGFELPPADSSWEVSARQPATSLLTCFVAEH